MAKKPGKRRRVLRSIAAIAGATARGIRQAATRGATNKYDVYVSEGDPAAAAKRKAAESGGGGLTRAAKPSRSRGAAGRKKTAAKKAAPKKSTAKKTTAPKKATAKKTTAPKKATAKKQAPKKAAPKAAPKKQAQKQAPVDLTKTRTFDEFKADYREAAKAAKTGDRTAVANAEALRKYGIDNGVLTEKGNPRRSIPGDRVVGADAPQAKKTAAPKAKAPKTAAPAKKTAATKATKTKVNQAAVDGHAARYADLDAKALDAEQKKIDTTRSRLDRLTPEQREGVAQAIDERQAGLDKARAAKGAPSKPQKATRSKPKEVKTTPPASDDMKPSNWSDDELDEAYITTHAGVLGKERDGYLADYEAEYKRRGRPVPDMGDAQGKGKMPLSKPQKGKGATANRLKPKQVKTTPPASDDMDPKNWSGDELDEAYVTTHAGELGPERDRYLADYKAEYKRRGRTVPDMGDTQGKVELTGSKKATANKLKPKKAKTDPADDMDPKNWSNDELDEAYVTTHAGELGAERDRYLADYTAEYKRRGRDLPDMGDDQGKMTLSKPQKKAVANRLKPKKVETTPAPSDDMNPANWSNDELDEAYITTHAGVLGPERDRYLSDYEAEYKRRGRDLPDMGDGQDKGKMPLTKRQKGTANRLKAKVDPADDMNPANWSNDELDEAYITTHAGILGPERDGYLADYEAEYKRRGRPVPDMGDDQGKMPLTKPQNGKGALSKQIKGKTEPKPDAEARAAEIEKKRQAIVARREQERRDRQAKEKARRDREAKEAAAALAERNERNKQAASTGDDDPYETRDMSDAELQEAFDDTLGVPDADARKENRAYARELERRGLANKPDTTPDTAPATDATDTDTGVDPALTNDDAEYRAAARELHANATTEELEEELQTWADVLSQWGDNPTFEGFTEAAAYDRAEQNYLTARAALAMRDEDTNPFHTDPPAPTTLADLPDTIDLPDDVAHINGLDDGTLHELAGNRDLPGDFRDLVEDELEHRSPWRPDGILEGMLADSPITHIERAQKKYMGEGGLDRQTIETRMTEAGNKRYKDSALMDTLYEGWLDSTVARHRGMEETHTGPVSNKEFARAEGIENYRNDIELQAAPEEIKLVVSELGFIPNKENFMRTLRGEQPKHSDPMVSMKERFGTRKRRTKDELLRDNLKAEGKRVARERKQAGLDAPAAAQDARAALASEAAPSIDDQIRDIASSGGKVAVERRKAARESALGVRHAELVERMKSHPEKDTMPPSSRSLEWHQMNAERAEAELTQVERSLAQYERDIANFKSQGATDKQLAPLNARQKSAQAAVDKARETAQAARKKANAKEAEQALSAAKAQDPTKPSGEGKPLTFRQFVAEKRRAASKKYDLSAAEAAQELPEGQFNAEYRDYLKKSFDQGADIPARHWNTLDEDLQRNLLRTPRALKDDSLTRKYRDMSRAKEPDAPKGVYDNKSVNSPDAPAAPAAAQATPDVDADDLAYTPDAELPPVAPEPPKTNPVTGDPLPTYDTPTPQQQKLIDQYKASLSNPTGDDARERVRLRRQLAAEGLDLRTDRDRRFDEAQIAYEPTPAETNPNNPGLYFAPNGAWGAPQTQKVSFGPGESDADLLHVTDDGEVIHITRVNPNKSNARVKLTGTNVNTGQPWSGKTDEYGNITVRNRFPRHQTPQQHHAAIEAREVYGSAYDNNNTDAQRIRAFVARQMIDRTPDIDGAPIVTDRDVEDTINRAAAKRKDVGLSAKPPRLGRTEFAHAKGDPNTVYSRRSFRLDGANDLERAQEEGLYARTPDGTVAPVTDIKRFGYGFRITSTDADGKKHHTKLEMGTHFGMWQNAFTPERYENGQPMTKDDYDERNRLLEAASIARARYTDNPLEKMAGDRAAADIETMAEAIRTKNPEPPTPGQKVRQAAAKAADRPTKSEYMARKPADRDAAVYEDALQGEASTTAQIAEATGMTRAQTLKTLNRLEQRGLIARQEQDDAAVGAQNRVSGGRNSNDDLVWVDNFRDGDAANERAALLDDHRNGTTTTTTTSGTGGDAEAWASNIADDDVEEQWNILESRRRSDTNARAGVPGRELTAAERDELEARRKALRPRLEANKEATNARYDAAYSKASSLHRIRALTNKELFEAREGASREKRRVGRNGGLGYEEANRRGRQLKAEQDRRRREGIVINEGDGPAPAPRSLKPHRTGTAFTADHVDDGERLLINGNIERNGVEMTPDHRIIDKDGQPREQYRNMKALRKEADYQARRRQAPQGTTPAPAASTSADDNMVDYSAIGGFNLTTLGDADLQRIIDEGGPQAADARRILADRARGAAASTAPETTAPESITPEYDAHGNVDRKQVLAAFADGVYVNQVFGPDRPRVAQSIAAHVRGIMPTKAEVARAAYGYGDERRVNAYRNGREYLLSAYRGYVSPDDLPALDSDDLPEGE